MRRRKGQTLIFENVLIFSISILLFMFSFMMFMNFQDYYRAVAVHDQLNKLENMVLAGVVHVVTTDEADSTVTIKIPETIANEYYTVGFDSGKLVLELNEVKKTSDVFDLQRNFQLLGSIVSKRGKITIYKNGDQINIL